MMKEQCKFKESCAFKNNIAEITGISLECTYDVKDSAIKGTFLIEGSYRPHELSINQDNYSFKLPFEYRLPSNSLSESVNLNVSDFTYTTDENNLNVEIEYDVSYEVKEEITTKEEFDRFLEEHEVEVVDINEDETDEEKISDYLCEEKIIPEKSDDEKIVIQEDLVNEDRGNDNQINEDIESAAQINVTNTIIDNISEREDEYITYHVYVCTEYDTLNSVAEKFQISPEILKSYNNVDTITAGMKVIIPSSSDEN